ncbi:hypothetical protein B4113_2274 [Geobacillus sp. B4113_201601]|nr:hypothetical protein B4113_2274 [Geobacillus sp. B4113_201601]
MWSVKMMKWMNIVFILSVISFILYKLVSRETISNTAWIIATFLVITNFIGLIKGRRESR